MLWHISDLHVGIKGLMGSPNHCSITFQKFLDLLSSRRNLSDDFFIFSGDLTTNGAPENFALFDQMLQRLIALGGDEKKLFFVPGNHDAWFGKNQIEIILKSLRINKLIRKRGYRKGRFFWNGLLEEFNDNFSIEENRIINGKNVQFILVDTCIHPEISRGLWPQINDVNLSEDVTRILVFHHHILDLERDFLGVRENKYKEKMMKVLNKDDAFDWIDRNEIRLILHGHKHYQFFSDGRFFPHVIAAPSLCEKRKDHFKEDGSQIGLNCIRIKKDYFDIALVRYNGEFIISEQKSFKKYLEG